MSIRAPSTSFPAALTLLGALALSLLGGSACGRADAPASGAAPAKSATAEASPESADAAAAKGTGGKLFEKIAAPLEFREAGEGPRAPTSDVFGARIGAAKVADVEALVAARGLTCKDTSIRAMMAAKREAEAKKRAEGGEDAVSSASWMKKKSKREENPQVRFACPTVKAEQVGDRLRPPSQGRLLFVFDSDEHPLRHASYQRSHRSHAAALADFEDAVQAMTAIFGEPSERRGELPVADAKGQVTFPQGRNLEVRWTFADLLVRVTAIHFGQKVTVGERIEVPHGVRPDAPILGKTDLPPPPPPTPAFVAPPPAEPPPAPKLSPEEEAALAKKMAQQ